MTKEKNIITDLWKYLNKPELNKIELKVFNWLNKDNLGGIILTDNIFYFEKTCSYFLMPNYVHNWLVKWIKNNYGLTYLGDLNK
jgi:hypothetical protein